MHECFTESKVKVIDPNSKHHNQVVDIEIRDGKLSRIGKKLKDVTRLKKVAIDGLCVSPGWVDLGAHVGEPGFEHREDLETVSRCAISGGYTAIAPFPNTEPVVDSKAHVSFFINKNLILPIHILPIAAVTKGCNGEEIAELQDMLHQGAKAFSDGLNPIQKSGILMRALEYVKPFEGLIIDQGVDLSVQPEGTIHESLLSTSLGIKGQSDLAETIQIQRNIDILNYTESRLLIHLISAGASIDLIKKARKNNVHLGCSVSAFHLAFDERSIENFDPNYKLNPPLREDSDRQSLVKAISKGDIDIICSHHTPLDTEHKVMAFSDATPGAIGLQTCYSMLKTFVPALDDEKIVECMSINPRKWLGLPPASILKGEEAELTLFHPESKWTFTQSENFSKSANSPVLDQELKGRVAGIYCKGELHSHIVQIG